MGTAIDRAFELAKSGHYRSVSEVIRHLPVEDRPAVEAHLANHEARRELILLCSAAWLATQ
jgi:Arc/MetJ-type ribon-helix-helix transcriptional regulator